MCVKDWKSWDKINIDKVVVIYVVRKDVVVIRIKEVFEC